MRVLAIVGALLLLLVVAGAAGLWRLQPPELLIPPDRGARFANVTVVEPGRARLPNRSVRIEGGAIGRISDAEPGADAEGFLLPGLIDMHVHDPNRGIEGQVDLFHMLYLAHGVTSTRNTGGWNVQLEDRVRIAAGEVAGPRIFACGSLIDGVPPIWDFSTTLEDPAGAEALVAAHAEAGFDCLKVYERLRPEVLEALVDAAHTHDLTVVGHVPQRVRLEDARIDDIQHLAGLARMEAREPVLDRLENLALGIRDWASLPQERIDFVVAVSLAQGLVHTPTLVVLHRSAQLDRAARLLEDPSLQLLPRFYGELTWDPRGTPWIDRTSPGVWDDARRGLAQAKRLTGALFHAGVPIFAGTDVGNPFLVPGASLHEELRHLVDAGLTPEQALAAATRVPGEFLGGPLGRVAEGAPADLALFREDPTRDLAALDTLEAVVADGRLYTREMLDTALAASERHYRGWLYEQVSMAIGRRQRADAVEAMRKEMSAP